MRKIFSGMTLILISTLSVSGFAMNIIHGKLLQHKEWTLGNVIKANINDIPESSLNQLISSKRKITDLPLNVDNISAFVSVPEVIGKASEPITVNAIHSMYIENNLTTSKTYTIKSALCVFTSLGILGCFKSEDRVNLDAGGILTIKDSPSYTFKLSGSCENSQELDLAGFMFSTVSRDGSPTYTTGSFGAIRICVANNK